MKMNVNCRNIFVYAIIALFVFAGLGFADVNISSTTCSVFINKTNVTGPAGGVHCTESTLTSDCTFPADKIVRIGSNQSNTGSALCVQVFSVDGLILDLNGTTIISSSSSATSVIEMRNVSSTRIINGTIAQISASTTPVNLIVSLGGPQNVSTNNTLANITIYNNSIS